MATDRPTHDHARPRPRKSAAFAALLAVLFSAGIPSFVGGEPPPVPEYAVKAAYLFHFAKFVEWPGDAFAGAASPIVICVLGEDPFGDALEALDGKTVNGRPIVIRYAATLGTLTRCHLLFVSASERTILPKVLQATKDWSLLTVGDRNGFARDGGIINLVKTEDRVGFEINLEAARRARLKISSKLLALAKIVDPGRRDGE